MVAIDECRQRLPLPALMGLLGMADAAQKSAKCPFHLDKTPSFGIFDKDGRWRFHCFGCGVHGDEIEFLSLHTGLPAKDAIKRYAELAGMDIKPGATRKKTGPPKGFEPPILQPLSANQVTEVAKWRGYTEEFVEEMNVIGVIGTYEGDKIAFPVQHGLHYKVEDGWRYTEHATADMFVLGSLDPTEPAHIWESQWDCLAFAMVTGRRDNLVSTRGASNVQPLAKMFEDYKGAIYLWPQNDAPGQKWAEEARKIIKRRVKVVATPPQHKDFNDWVRSGGVTREEIDKLMSSRAYDGFIFMILQWDKGQCLLQSQSRPHEVAHAVLWNDRGQFKCSCESKEFGDPSCKHELYVEAVLDAIKNRKTS